MQNTQDMVCVWGGSSYIHVFSHNSLEISALLKLLPSKDLGKTQCEERSQQQLLKLG